MLQVIEPTIKTCQTYFNKSSAFHIGVASIEAAEDVSIEEFMPYFKDILIYGYMEEDGYRFTIPLPGNMSNITLTDYSIERINGIEVGRVVISYDQKGRNKTYRMSGKFFWLSKK